MGREMVGGEPGSLAEGFKPSLSALLHQYKSNKLKEIVMDFMWSKPEIFAAPRFMFPYSMVGRPFPLKGFKVSAPLPKRQRLGIRTDMRFRQEFFGSLAFRQYMVDDSPFGNIVYLNHSASRIIHTLADFQDIDKLAAHAEGLGCGREELELFLHKCLFLDIITALFPPGAPPEWDERLWSNGDRHLSSPLRLYVNITERCNLVCKHCYACIDGQMRQLDRALLERVFDQALVLKIPTIVLIGGEPLLYPDFKGVLRGAIERGLSVFTNTNGLLLTEKCCKELMDVKLKMISVSLDGPDAERHDAVRGKGSFQKAITGIENAVNAGMKVSLSITITKDTVDDVDSFFELGRVLGVCDYHIMALVPVGRGKEQQGLLPDHEKIFELKSKLEVQMSEDDDITINCTSAIDPVLVSEWHENFSWNEGARHVYSGCEAGRFRLEVGFDGSIIPCVLLGDKPFRAGHAAVDNIGDVWRDSKIIRSLSSYEIKDDHDCRNCASSTECQGGCKGVIYSHTGSLDSMDPTCKGGIMR